MNIKHYEELKNKIAEYEKTKKLLECCQDYIKEFDEYNCVYNINISNQKYHKPICDKITSRLKERLTSIIKEELIKEKKLLEEEIELI